MTKTTTPWGPATLVEKVAVSQRAGEKHFSSVFELLEDAKGARLIRIAYATGGSVVVPSRSGHGTSTACETRL